jgi:hypothetical protein
MIIITWGQNETDHAEKYIHPIKFDQKRHGAGSELDPSTASPNTTPTTMTNENMVKDVRASDPNKN